MAELKATLSAIEGDVDELDDSVLAVEEKGVAARLGISHAQVRERRAFVERVKRELAVSARSRHSGDESDLTLQPTDNAKQSAGTRQLFTSESALLPNNSSQLIVCARQDLARRRASAVPPSYFPPIGGHDDDFDNDDAQDDGDASYEMQHQTVRFTSPPRV